MPFYLRYAAGECSPQTPKSSDHIGGVLAPNTLFRKKENTLFYILAVSSLSIKKLKKQQETDVRSFGAQPKQSFQTLYAFNGRILCRVSVGFLCSTRLATKSGEYVDLVLQIVLLSSTTIVQQYTHTRAHTEPDKTKASVKIQVKTQEKQQQQMSSHQYIFR